MINTTAHISRGMWAFVGVYFLTSTIKSFIPFWFVLTVVGLVTILVVIQDSFFDRR